MDRFFGTMPSSEIEIEKRFKDSHGFTITIQAGKHGWTIIYADSSTKYQDIDVSSANENFDTAYKIAVDELGDLTPVTAANKYSYSRECDDECVYECDE